MACTLFLGRIAVTNCCKMADFGEQGVNDAASLMRAISTLQTEQLRRACFPLSLVPTRTDRVPHRQGVTNTNQKGTHR